MTSDASSPNAQQNSTSNPGQTTGSDGAGTTASTTDASESSSSTSSASSSAGGGSATGSSTGFSQESSTAQANPFGSAGAKACAMAALCKNVNWMGGFELAKQVVLDPVGVWKRVKPEPWTVEEIYKNYFIPFLAIPTVANYIGFDVLGPGSIFFGLLSKALYYILTLVFAYGLAVLMKEMANKFGGSLTIENALKLIVVASLPGFFAGAVMIIPWMMLIFIPVLASLAGAYAFYQGVPEMTQIPEPKRLQFFCVLVATVIVVSLIVEKIF